MNTIITRFSILLLALLLGACASRQADDGDSMSFEEFQSQYVGSEDIEGLNQQLLSMAVSTDTSESVYRLGPGDEITMKVFGVEELSGNFRIDGMGRVSLPLIGEAEVSGYTLKETEDLLARRYGEEYLRNPQISISVMEFRSQQFTAVGAVSQPRVYNTQRKITLIEALAMAGGLSENAGPYVYLSDRIRNPETGQLGTRSLAIALDDLTQGQPEMNVVLGESALVNVPRAGSIFVEGAVERPGVYQQRGATTVLKAITMAGGLSFEAKRNNIAVLRRDAVTGEWKQQVVAMEDIRESPNADITLGDGDIVLVDNGPIKTAWVGMWSGLGRIVMLGFRPL
ncbi:MAG: polysaccharide biosynthesis/export family protein [Wenzhouxiangellaceae bacterium]|nr:polysaccharide biosynthesis/export family protein [Wenzhouxiangellaceae bacterium]